MKKINKFILAIASCPMLVTPIIGCTKKQEEPEKTILTITGEKIIDVYEAEIKYAAKDQKGNIVKCKWTIDKTEVATIDLITGVLTPVSAGTATITAVSTEDETVKVSFNIQVVDSFGQWTTTWNTYYQNFIDLGEKYEDGTVDPNHIVCITEVMFLALN